jgi:hypothetical protein
MMTGTAIFVHRGHDRIQTDNGRKVRRAVTTGLPGIESDRHAVFFDITLTGGQSFEVRSQHSERGRSG